MKALLPIIVASLLWAPSWQEQETPVRFTTVDLYVDAGTTEIAAWQVEFAAETGDVTLSGIEGGEHPAWSEPPSYDPAALQGDRVILAAFSTGIDLPTGRTRVATLHLMVTGDTPPQYVAKVVAAAAAGGEKVAADVDVVVTR